MLPSQWPSWIYTSNSPVHLLNFYVVASKFDYWESNFANSFFVPKTAEISKNNLSRTCSKNSGFNGIIKWDNGNWPCSLMSVIFKFSLGQIALKSSLIFQLFSFHITLKFLHFFFLAKSIAPSVPGDTTLRKYLYFIGELHLKSLNCVCGTYEGVWCMSLCVYVVLWKVHLHISWS